MISIPTVVFLAFAWPPFAIAKSIHVPECHQSIQDAIDAAEPGDTIEVAAGTYQERVILKLGITVRGVGVEGKGKLGLARAEATIIDGGGEDGRSPGMTMAEGLTLDGFTITSVAPDASPMRLCSGRAATCKTRKGGIHETKRQGYFFKVSTAFRRAPFLWIVRSTVSPGFLFWER